MTEIINQNTSSIDEATVEQRNVYLSVSLPADIHRRAKVLASIKGLALSKFARDLLIEQVNIMISDKNNIQIP